MGLHGCKPKNGITPEGRLQPSLQGQTSFNQKSNSQERICQCPQEQLPEGGIAYPFKQTGHRTSQGSFISGLLQPPLLGSQTQQQVVSHLRPPPSEKVPEGPKFQSVDSRVNKAIAANRRVGLLP